MAMKILYSCLSKSWGNMELDTLTAVKNLLGKNLSAELLCHAESRIHIEANNMGFITHPVKAGRYIHPFTSLKIANLIFKGKYSLVHTQLSRDLWVIVPALKLINSKIPLYLTKQIESHLIKKDIFHRFLYKRVTKAFTLNNIIRENLQQTCPIPDDKIFLLQNDVNTENFNGKLIFDKVIEHYKEDLSLNKD